MRLRLQWLLPLLLLAVTSTAFAQTPGMRERVQGAVAALRGTPEDFEKFAQSAYAKSLLDASTPERRMGLIKRLKQDFGEFDNIMVRRESPTRVAIAVEGSTGTSGTIFLEHEADEPYKITALNVAIGADDGEKPKTALPPVPIKPEMSAQELGTALDAYVKKLEGEDRFAGTLLIARDGKAIFEKSYGLANRSDNVPNTPATRFNVGSINKHFTKASIAQLAKAGKLALADTLSKHLPDYPNADAHKATLQQLVDHTAGLADFFSMDFAQTSKARFRSNHDYYTYTAPKPLQFQPGTRRDYCNSCYIVLGEIVERLSGMPYEQYVERNVFEPAGMKNSDFLSTDGINPNMAIGYTHRSGPRDEQTLRTNVTAMGVHGSGAGGAYATASDLLAFDNAFREMRVMDGKWTAWFVGDDDETFTGRADFAEGYAGGSPGCNASVEGDGKWTVIALANIDPPAAESLTRVIRQALRSN